MSRSAHTSSRVLARRSSASSNPARWPIEKRFETRSSSSAANDLTRQSMGGPAKGTVWSNEVITPEDRLRIKMKPGTLYADQMRSEP